MSKKIIQKKVYFMQSIFLCSLAFFLFSLATAFAAPKNYGGSMLADVASDYNTSPVDNSNLNIAVPGSTTNSTIVSNPTDGANAPAESASSDEVNTTSLGTASNGTLTDTAATNAVNSASSTTATATTTATNTTTANTAASSAAASGTISFGNPLGGITTVDGLLNSILTAARGIVVILAIIAIVVGGIMYIFAGINENMLKAGKTAITYALVGLAIVVAAPAFLQEIVTVLGGTSSGVVNTSAISGALTFTAIGTNVLNFLLSIVGILGIIGLVMGGGFYLTSYTDSKQAEKGKSIATYSLIGITIALAAMILVRQIATLLTSQ